jgi:hypothetical protein
MHEAECEGFPRVGRAGGCTSRSAFAREMRQCQCRAPARVRAEDVLEHTLLRLQMVVCLAVVVHEAALFELMLFSRPGVTILVADRG